MAKGSKNELIQVHTSMKLIAGWEKIVAYYIDPTIFVCTQRIRNNSFGIGFGQKNVLEFLDYS